MVQSFWGCPDNARLSMIGTSPWRLVPVEDEHRPLTHSTIPGASLADQAVRATHLTGLPDTLDWAMAHGARWPSDIPGIPLATVALELDFCWGGVAAPPNSRPLASLANRFVY